jgi:hypothetical protein
VINKKTIEDELDRVLVCLKVESLQEALISSEYFPFDATPFNSFLDLVFSLSCFNYQQLDFFGGFQSKAELQELLSSFHRLFCGKFSEIFEALLPNAGAQKVMEWIVYAIEDGKSRWKKTDEDYFFNDVEDNSVIYLGHDTMILTSTLAQVQTKYMKSYIHMDPYENVSLDAILSVDLLDMSKETKCGSSEMIALLPPPQKPDSENEIVGAQMLVMCAALFHHVTFPLIDRITELDVSQEHYNAISQNLLIGTDFLKSVGPFWEKVCGILLHALEHDRAKIAALPQFIIEGVIRYYHLVVSNNSDALIFNSGINLAFKTLSELLVASDVITNYHLRLNIIHIFWKHVESSNLLYIINSKTTSRNFLNNLLRFALEHNQKKDNPFTRLQTRLYYLIERLWSERSHQSYVEHRFKERLSLMRQLLPQIISEQIMCSERTFESMKSLKNIEDEANADSASERSELARNAKTMNAYHLSLFKVLNAIALKTPWYFEPYFGLLAQMLHVNINIISSPARAEFGIDIKQANFLPKEKTSLILDIISSFTVASVKQEQWLISFTDVERGYNSANVDALGTTTIAGLHLRKGLVYKAFFARAIKVSAFLCEEKQKMAEDNPELADPITNELMQTPVRLPVSGNVVDLATIRLHLKSRQDDPFTRTPLTEADLLPCPEISQRLDDFWTQVKLRIKTIISQQ